MGVGDVLHRRKLDEAIGWARKYSIFQYPFVTACCGMEYMATACSHYDVDRFGAGLPRFSPRQADVLFVVGTISHKMAPVLKRIYDQMCEPKWVVAFGVCTCTGGFYDNYATVQGIDTIIPVDVYIPGCPPRPESVLDGLMKLQDKIAVGHPAVLSPPARTAHGRSRHPRAAARALRRGACSRPTTYRGDHTAVRGPRGLCPSCCASAGTTPRSRSTCSSTSPRWTTSSIPGREDGPRFEVVYHLYSVAHNHRVRLKVRGRARTTPVVPTACRPLAHRQLARARGVGHVRHPLRRPPRSAPPPHVRGVRGPPAAQGLPDQPPPAADRARKCRRDACADAEPSATPPAVPMPARRRSCSWARAGPRAAARTCYVNMGPAHPAMHGIIRIFAELDGETVVKTDVEIGYLHRAFEKDCEVGPLQQRHPVHRPAQLRLAADQQLRLRSAVEKLLGIEITERCKYIRVIMSEISRICDHLTCVGAARHGAGRLHRLPLHDQGARVPLGARRGRHRRAAHHLLRPRRRASRPTCPPGFDAQGRRRRSRRRARSSRRSHTLAHRQPHLHGPDGRASARSRARRRIALGDHGAAAARGRRAVRRAQGAALLGVRPDGLRDPARQERRQLRPLPRAHGRDGAVDADRRAGARRACPGGADQVDSRGGPIDPDAYVDRGKQGKTEGLLLMPITLSPNLQGQDAAAHAARQHRRTSASCCRRRRRPTARSRG